MNDRTNRTFYGIGIVTVNLPAEKYLFIVISNDKEHKVVAENLTQVVNQYPEADRIENAGVIEKIL